MPILRYLKNLLLNSMVTLRFSLLSIFITLFILTLISLFSVFYFHIDDLVNSAASLLVEKEAFSLINDLNIHLYPLEGASKFTTELIETKVLDVKSETETENYLVHLVQKLPLVNGAYWGDEQGNFVYVRKEFDGTITSEIIHRDVTPATQVYKYRNLEGKITSRISMNPDFDPRDRPWYKEAFKRKQTFWTNVYVFAQGPEHLGIAIASPAYLSDGKPWGVYGMDIRLDYLSRYVAKQKVGKHGEVFIVDDSGELLASPKLSQVNPATYYKNGLMDLRAFSSVYGDAFAIFQKTGKPVFIFKSGGVNYVAGFSKVPSLVEHGWYIGIVDPQADFTSPINKIKLNYLIFDTLIFIIGIMIILRLVTMIVTPIKKLEQETHYIKNFNLEARPRILSRIKEVIELSNGLQSMKIGLRSFQKYVPASLVRKLIQVGEDVRIGGVKRQLVVFFSDINNFTAITEKAETNQLVQQVCEYFDAFSHVITVDKGTIDKYIGDSLMAFWGAPLPVSHPCVHAARATLACYQEAITLNARWVKEGKPALLTRFGLHYGDTIVGNIGSSERLNYTALGDTVNIASRLVGANKVYGTVILVSETIYTEIKDQFQLRFVDQLMLKGKVESLKIYELLAESKQSILFDIDKYRQVFAEAFLLYEQQKWSEAIKKFSECLEIYPEDTLALTFMTRCHQFMSNPPSPTWDGVWRLSEK